MDGGSKGTQSRPGIENAMTLGLRFQLSGNEKTLAPLSIVLKRFVALREELARVHIHKFISLILLSDDQIRSLDHY